MLQERKGKSGLGHTRGRTFIEDHPQGVATTDLNIAAALLLCSGTKLVRIDPKPGNSREVIFVLNGDKELLQRRALQFFSGKLDGKTIGSEEGDGPVALCGMFSDKVRTLKDMVRQGIRGPVPGSAGKEKP